MNSDFCAQAEVVQGLTWEPLLNENANQSLARVLECHARLYVFPNGY